MKLKRYLVVVALLCAAAAPVHAARNTPMVTPGVITLPAPEGKTVSAARVREAVLASAALRGWLVDEEQPGLIRLTYAPRNKHKATIDVRYGDGSFEIVFVSSFNLNEDKRDGALLIHPNYNNWINNLVQDVRARSERPQPAASAPA